MKCLRSEMLDGLIETCKNINLFGPFNESYKDQIQVKLNITCNLNESFTCPCGCKMERVVNIFEELRKREYDPIKNEYAS